jgi:ankyrin repeat protein
MEEIKPMHMAAAVGDVVNIRRMVAEGADVNVQGGPQGARPLHMAAANGHVDAVRVLKEVGADVEASDADGSRPLHAAAKRGHWRW